MYFTTLVVASLAASAASCSQIPSRRTVARTPRDTAPYPYHAPASRQLQQRATASETFEFGLSIQNQNIFSGDWTGQLPAIPIPGTPLEVQPEDSFSFSLDCIDCRTYGSIVAAISNDNGLSVGLTFVNAGAFLDFGLKASNALTVTLTLGKFFNPGANLTTGGFEASIGLGLNLVLSLTTTVEMTGGFQLCIPDGAQLGFNVNLEQGENGLLTADADITALPEITFALLPLTISTAANITAALVLKTEVGIAADLGLISGSAGAGAALTLAEVNLGQVTSNTPGQCPRALFVDIESSAGAYANAAIVINDENLLPDANPSVSTIFASAGTTTCLGAAAPTFPAVTASPLLPSQATTDCAASQLVTETTTITATNSLTACLAQGVVNCPASLTQLILVTTVDTVTATRCPGALSLSAASAGLGYGYTNTTIYPSGAGGSSNYTVPATMTVSVAPVTCPATAIAIPTLDVPVVSTGLPGESGSGSVSISRQGGATVTGKAGSVDTVTSVTTTVPGYGRGSGGYGRGSGGYGGYGGYGGDVEVVTTSSVPVATVIAAVSNVAVFGNRTTAYGTGTGTGFVTASTSTGVPLATVTAGAGRVGENLVGALALVAGAMVVLL
ncbi:hypothetical protein B0T17DRAFT_406803 [Bombardia bombarda]|uniref:Uncharacterized protein n=1 Tax=Bombardia bombarda TaxID=252184 RepID=A0AA39TPI7_9PEZI|nr:hypothetical protein B0T17DRAFT_406803 [Bombardia bombarda]